MKVYLFGPFTVLKLVAHCVSSSAAPTLWAIQQKLLAKKFVHLTHGFGLYRCCIRLNERAFRG